MTTSVPRWAGARQPDRPRHLVHGMEAPSRTSQVLKTVVLVVTCLLVAGPFVSVLSTSLADRRQVTAAGGFVLWPDHPTLDAYRAILSGGVVTRALFVSIGVTAVGTLLAMVCTVLLAYSLSRPGSFGHKPALMAVLMSLLFAPGIIPSYLLVKQLGLLDSYWSLILPGVINSFFVIVLRAFFMELPQELLDAALIDGASDLRILTSIILPLSKAVLAVISLFYGVAYWGDFFSALLYINDTEKWPLTLVLRTYIVNGATLGTNDVSLQHRLPPQQSLQMAILVISIVPVMIVYPFVQRHFTKGFLVGAIKG